MRAAAIETGTPAGDRRNPRPSGRGVVNIDSITGRCPAADAAFDAWAESDNYDPHAAVRAIVAAAKGA